MRLFLTSLSIFVLGTLTVPHVAKAETTVLFNPCGAFCNAEERRPVPFSDELICFYIEQDVQDGVPFFIYRNGDLINKHPDVERHPGEPKPLHNQIKAPSDRYCIGAWYIRQATEIVVCNSHWSVTLSLVDIRTYLAAGDRAPQTRHITLCLMAAGECVERLYVHGVQ